MLLQDPRPLDDKRDELAKARHGHQLSVAVKCSNANHVQEMCCACSAQKAVRAC